MIKKLLDAGLLAVILAALAMEWWERHEVRQVMLRVNHG